MGYTGETMVNQLEQITMEMPEVTVYLAGDHHVREKDISFSCGGEKLELESLSRAADTDSLHYYIDLDISASVSHEEFAGVCRALQTFGKSIRDNDRITLITFGDEVKKVFSMSGAEIQADNSYDEMVGKFENHDKTTAFYEALKWTSGKMEAEREADTRSVLCVITDGKDDSGRSSVTLTEARDALTQKGFPLYAFTAGMADEEGEASLEELTGASGGYAIRFSPGTEEEGLKELQSHLLRSYRAKLRSDTNLISYGMETVTFENKSDNNLQKRTVLQNRWIKDTEAPIISKVERCSDSQLKVCFSEAVEGSESAAGYLLTDQETGIQSVPVYACAARDKKSAVLTFPSMVKGGTYSLSAENITDISMEQNALTEASDFTLDPAFAQNVTQKENTEESGQEDPATAEETETFETEILETLSIDPGSPNTETGPGTFFRRNLPAIGVGILLLVAITALLTRRSLQRKRKKKSFEKMTISFGSGSEKLQIILMGTYIVGSARECDLRISDSKMDAQHFALGLERGVPVITNLSRTLPTLLNGSRLVSGEYQLRSGDVVEAGNTRMKLIWA